MKRFVFGGGGFDKEEAEVVFYPRAGEGFFKYRRLQDLQAGKVIFAIHVVDVFFTGFDFSGAVQASIQHGKQSNDDARVTDEAGAHAEIIFGAAKDVAAQQFAAEGAFYPKKEQDHHDSRADVSDEVASQGTKEVAGLVEELAERFIGNGANEDNAKPAEQRDKALRHAFSAALVDADAEDDDEGEVKGIKRQGVQAHSRVFWLKVRANCIL